MPEPRVVGPVVLAIVLALTSVPMQLASRAARAGRMAPARMLVVAALTVQAAYLAYELHDYRDQLHASGITRDAYSSIYYTLLGADHVHVALGILFDLWLLARLARGLTTYRANAAQAIAWYWHFVNWRRSSSPRPCSRPGYDAAPTRRPAVARPARSAPAPGPLGFIAGFGSPRPSAAPAARAGASRTTSGRRS